MSQRIIRVILASLKQTRRRLKHPVEASSAETVLYGPGSTLDSMGLVTLLVDIEQRVEETLGRPVSLMDEQALSQSRSPFRTVSSLAEYIEGVLVAQHG